jgi:hypothetical protein
MVQLILVYTPRPCASTNILQTEAAVDVCAKEPVCTMILLLAAHEKRKDTDNFLFVTVYPKLNAN